MKSIPLSYYASKNTQTRIKNVTHKVHGRYLESCRSLRRQSEIHTVRVGISLFGWLFLVRKETYPRV